MIHNRAIGGELHLRGDGTDRLVSGTLVPYGETVEVTEYGKTYREDFAPHALAAEVGRAADVELCALHPRSGDVLPVGITTAFTDTAAGLDGEWEILPTEFGSDVLTLIRAKAVRYLSAGFVEGRNRWHSRDAVTRVTASLDHASVVRRPAYPNARLRAAEGQHDVRQLIARMRLR